MARRRKERKGSRGGRDKAAVGAEEDGRQQSSLDAFAAIREAVANATGSAPDTQPSDTPESENIESATIQATLGQAPTPAPEISPEPPAPSTTASSPTSDAVSAGDSNEPKSIIEAAKIESGKVGNLPSAADEMRGSSPIRTFSMPSAGSTVHRPPTTDVDYHDLGELFAEAPVPQFGDGMVFHRGALHELAGVSQLLDWVSEGDAVIVELSRILTRETEFAIAVDKLSTFIEGDIGGQIIQLTDSRLLLLPPGCRGIRGVESESFVAEA
ncbi:MAG TPA: hypothetical protein EYO09_03970 [Candidatus Poseidoniales archaeon]|nr:hypothetical protein [Candidatus Poseidoniales archaeon]